MGNSVDERVLAVVSAFVNAEFRAIEELVATGFTVAYGLGHFHTEVLVSTLIGGELEVRRTGEVGLLHIGAIVVLPRYGVGIAEGRNNERIPTFVLLPSVEVNDVVAVFVGYHVAVLVHLLSLAGFEGSVSLGTPDRDLFGCTAVGVTVVTLHPLEEEFALGVVELELEEVVALPSIVTAVPAGVEVGFGVAVEEDSGAVLFAHTFFLVSHEAREVFAVGDQTIVGKCTAGRLLEAVARSINTHVSEALVVGSLCLGDELLCLFVVDVLFGALEEVLYFLFGDGASLEGRTVSLPVPNYGTVVVTTGVYTAEVPTIAAVVAPILTFTAPEVGRVEAEVTGVVAAGHDVVRSLSCIRHFDTSTGNDTAVGRDVLSRTYVTVGCQVLEEEVTGLSVVLRHLPDVLEALVVERCILLVSDVATLVSPMQLLVLVVHSTTVIECTVVIAGTLRAVRGEDVVAGLEHLTRSGEGRVSLGQIYHKLVNFTVGSRCATVENLLRLGVECQESVVLLCVVLTDVVTAGELFGEFVEVEVCAERFGDYSLEVFLSRELVDGIHQPSVAVVVRTLTGIAVERSLGAGEEEVVLAVRIVLFLRLGRNEYDGVVSLHKREGAQVERRIAGFGFFDVSAQTLDGLRGVRAVSFGMRPLVGVFRIAGFSDLLHFELPSTIRCGGVEVLVRRICKILVFV